MADITIINIKRTHYLEHINGDAKQGYYTRFEIETNGAFGNEILRFAQQYLFHTSSEWYIKKSFIVELTRIKESYSISHCHNFLESKVYYTLEPLNAAWSTWAITIYRPFINWLYHEENFKI